MTWMEMKKKISHLIELSRNLEKALNIREAAARLVGDCRICREIEQYAKDSVLH